MKFYETRSEANREKEPEDMVMHNRVNDLYYILKADTPAEIKARKKANMEINILALGLSVAIVTFMVLMILTKAACRGA